MNCKGHFLASVEDIFVTAVVIKILIRISTYYPRIYCDDVGMKVETIFSTTVYLVARKWIGVFAYHNALPTSRRTCTLYVGRTHHRRKLRHLWIYKVISVIYFWKLFVEAKLPIYNSRGRQFFVRGMSWVSRVVRLNRNNNGFTDANKICFWSWNTIKFFYWSTRYSYGWLVSPSKAR